MKRHILALVIFVGLMMIMSYPLIFNFNKFMPAFFSTDESYAIVWNSWRINFSLAHNLSLSHSDFTAYPLGTDCYPRGFLSYPLFFYNYLLSILTTPVLTYNLQIFLNFILSAFITYLLVRNLTGNLLSGILGGIILGFCPFMFVRSWQHIGETYVWIMPLFLLLLFKLKTQDNLSIKILFVFSFILTTFNFDISYYVVVILGVFFIYSFLSGFWKQDKAYLKKIFLLMLAAFLLLSPQLYQILVNTFFSNRGLPSAFNIFYRPFEDLFMQSAKPLSYLLPAAVHPVFGKFTEQFIGSPLYGESFTEHTLYLGWVPLILAFIAFRKWRRAKRKGGLEENDRFYIGFFVLLALVAWFFSQPPWWRFGALKIYMPSFFMYKVLPMFRAYCRFGIVVMLAVSVLAGFGLKFLLARFKSIKTKTAVTVFCCGLVLFEFWNWPPYKVLDVSKVPEVYYWVKALPADCVIAEYPLDANGPNEMRKLYQVTHEHRMINGTIPGTFANKVSKTITNLSDARTAAVLKWLGVKYVIVHREDYLKDGSVAKKEELERIGKNPKLKLVKTFPAQGCPQKGIMCIRKTGPIDVYEIIAEPEKPRIAYEK